jgi:hypothetical protein
MAKITISRLFEVSKYMTTDAGKELSDALQYLSEFVEVTIRNLRNGLTFTDNFNSIGKTVTVRPNNQTVVVGKDETRRVKEVVCRRVIDDKYYRLENFGWKYLASGDLVIMADFIDGDGSSPASTTDVILDLLIHFG